MSRHRNIRLLHDDDLNTYDEAAASSADDSPMISPITTEGFIYNSENRKLQDLSCFTQRTTETLGFSNEVILDRTVIDEEPLNVSPDDLSEATYRNLFSSTDTHEGVPCKSTNSLRNYGKETPEAVLSIGMATDRKLPQLDSFPTRINSEKLSGYAHFLDNSSNSVRFGIGRHGNTSIIPSKLGCMIESQPIFSAVDHPHKLPGTGAIKSNATKRACHGYEPTSSNDLTSSRPLDNLPDLNVSSRSKIQLQEMDFDQLEAAIDSCSTEKPYHLNVKPQVRSKVITTIKYNPKCSYSLNSSVLSAPVVKVTYCDHTLLTENSKYYCKDVSDESHVVSHQASPVKASRIPNCPIVVGATQSAGWRRTKLDTEDTHRRLKFTLPTTIVSEVAQFNSTLLGVHSVGNKKPSTLGQEISCGYLSDAIKCNDLNYFLLNFSPIILRSRSIIHDLLFSSLNELPVFRFDTPEPINVKRSQAKPDCLKKFILPVPWQRKHPSAHNVSKRLSPVLSDSISRLTDSVSMKLSMTLNCDESSRPVEANQSYLTPNKFIDRGFLLNEYIKLKNEESDKKVVNLVVLGHVDAGKSTLMGNLLFQLGHVSTKQLGKYQWEAQKLGKASFAYAWILDQMSEERSRGITMDIAQTSFETKNRRIALMDAPGHRDFVPQVIGGASQADVAVLVVNATRGEFETGIGAGGQTREHIRLARLVGVTHLIVAVNKMDTVDWDRDRFVEIQSELIRLLKSMNFSNVFCPVSGLRGINLVPNDQLSNTNSTLLSTICEWYDGPCLLELIDAVPVPDRPVDAPFRFVVSDIFKAPCSSMPAVAGRVVSGAVSAGINLPTSKVICPTMDLRASVKSIRSLCKSGDADSDGDLGSKLLEQSVKYAFAGDQVVLFLADVDPSRMPIPGSVLTDPDNPIAQVSRIRAKLLIFTAKQPITRGYPVIFYFNYINIPATITKLICMNCRQNKVEKTVTKPRCILGNCTADVEINFDRPICLEEYEKCKALGRFMLRVGGESIAGGTVTSILPPKQSRLNEP